MRRLSRGRIEHDGRRRLVQTLLCTGPLTARGLARETERPMSQVNHHMRVLTRTGIVEPIAGQECHASDETAFAVRLEGTPEWVYEVLLGGFSLRTCLLLMNHLADAGALGVSELARRAALSKNDAARYLWYLGSLGLVAHGGSY